MIRAALIALLLALATPAWAVNEVDVPMAHGWVALEGAGAGAAAMHGWVVLNACTAVPAFHGWVVLEAMLRRVWPISTAHAQWWPFIKGGGVALPPC